MMHNTKPIRRREKELDNETTLNILNDGFFGTLALSGSDGAYAVPLNYVFKSGEIFFHSAKEGHKIDCIKQCKNACFNVVGKYEIDPDFTTRYQSATVSGEIEFIADETEKRDALILLCRKYYDYDESFLNQTIDQSLERTLVYKMICRRITGKGVPVG